jgi:hypothetical protein
VPLPLTRFQLAERSDTLNDVSFARRSAGIFLRGFCVPAGVRSGDKHFPLAVANENGAPRKGRAVFFFGQQSGAVAARRRRHQYMLNDSGDGEKASGKKIPAFRRANDTPFNVSERSAN